MFHVPEGKEIQRYGILAEPELIHHHRIVQQALVLAMVLADQGIRDVQHHLVSHGRERVNLWNGRAEPEEVILEPDEVIHTALGQAVEVAVHASRVVVEHRGDVDDFGDLPGEQPGDVGAPSHAFAFASELNVAPDELAEDGAFRTVEDGFFEADVGAAFQSHAVVGGEFGVAGLAQVGSLPIPNDDVVGG